MQVVDFALICALREEAEAFLKHVENYSPGKLGPYDCYYTHLRRFHEQGPGALRTVVIVLDRMGNLASLHASALVLKDLAPQHLILFGICGGILGAAEDFRLGDVVISDRVVYYEPAKTRPTGPEERAVHFPPCGVYRASPLMTAALAHQRGGWTAEDLIKSPRPGDSNARIRPDCKSGLVCSGEKVIADSARAADLKRQFPEAISIEMEAAGVAYACEGTTTSFLVVKAVSDYANEEKDDSHREYAAATAAAFLYSLLRDAPLPRDKRDASRLVLADLLQLIPAGRTEVIMPGYPNPRHKKTGIANYPYNEWESAYDDVFCAWRIMSALELASGRQNVRCVFDQEKGVGAAENTILIGSSVSNCRTRLALADAYFRFGADQHDHAIVDRSGTVRYDARTLGRTGGAREFVADYALITVMRQERHCTVVLAGCRAYGQVLLGDFLTDAEKVEDLYQRTNGHDFQVVLKADVVGREYTYAGMTELVTRRRGSGWQPAAIDAG